MVRQGEFVAALSNIRSLHNVGAIFRSADVFGVDKLILGGYTGTPPRKEITKTALGAQTWVPWEKKYHLATTLREYKKKGFYVVGLETNMPQAIPLPEFVPQFPLLLVVGNEVRGISKSVQKEVDTFVAVPMRGRKESLNVAVAFGIAAYQISSKLKVQN